MERGSEAEIDDPPEAPTAAQRPTGAPLRPVAKAHPGDDRLAVTLTVAELTELVRRAALEAATDLAEPAPALLDRAGLARALGVGITSVDRLRREGMPAIWLGDPPRFELTACLEWLRARGRGQQ